MSHRAGRSWLVVAILIIFIGTAVAIGGQVILGWRFGLGTSDQVTILNTVLAASAYIAVALTLIVALAAYIAATGRPDLSVEITFRFSQPNRPIFRQQSEPSALGRRTVAQFRQVEGEVVVRNASKYAARNPGIRIELEDLGGLSEQPGWSIVSTVSQIGITKLQWDGGGDYLIHPRWSRTIPPLDFTGLFAFGNSSAILVDLAADGYNPRRIRIPIEILTDHEYDQRVNEASIGPSHS